MTSKRSSPADHPAGIPFSEYWRHMLWSEGLTYLMYFLYHVVTVAVVLATYVRTDGGVFENTIRTARSLLGAFNPVLLVTFVSACTLAFHGFSYLTDKRALDFYESQPFSRRRHFAGICLHGFSVFLSAYALTKVLGLLIAAGMGAFSAPLIKAALLDALCNVCLFAASYGICVLAVMLTGSILVSVVAGCVLMLYEVTLRLFLDLLARGYFSTFADALNGWSFTRAWTFPFIYWGRVKRFCLHDLLLAAVVFTASYLLYRIRRNEDAGRSVLYAPVRMIVKILVAILPALFVGYLLAESAGVVTAYLCAALFALITACVMEIIYAKDFKALFRHLPGTLAAIVLGVGILTVYFIDPFGYDSYVPDPAKIVSSAVIYDDHYTDHYGFEFEIAGVSPVEYQAENMYLEDAEAVTDLAEYLRDAACEEGSVVTILYRFGNGKQAARRYFLPEGTDPALFDPIIGSRRFKEGNLQIYNEPLMEYVAKDGKILVGYECNSMEFERVEMPLSELEEAYKADLEKLDYSYIRDHFLLGMINVPRRSGSDEYGEIRFPVLSGFDNTIALLKSKGIFIEPYAVSEIKSLTISAFVPEGSEVDVAELMKSGGRYEYDTITFEITDQAVLSQIFPEGVTERAYSVPLVNSSRGVLWKADCFAYIADSDGNVISCDVRPQDLPEEILRELEKYIG